MPNSRFAPVLLFLLSAIAQLSAQAIDPAALRNDSLLFRKVLEIPNRYINDHCLIRKDSLWHLFYTTGHISKKKWYRDGNEAEIGHAVSPDLLTWRVLPPAFSTGPAGSFNAGHVYAPYVIERDGVYFMFYTGTPGSPMEGENLCLATSTDLTTWVQHPNNPLFRDAAGQTIRVSERDPHIYYDSAIGYIMYFVARLREDSAKGRADQEFSCVAAATSPDLLNWTDRGPVLVRRTNGYDAFTYMHPESPCVIKKDGLYYLFYKSGSGMRYVISETPLDFRDRAEYFLSTAHAGEIVEWDGRWYLTSCSRQVNDIAHAWSDRTQGMFLARLTGVGLHPMVARIPDGPKEPVKFSILPNMATNRATVWLRVPLGEWSPDAPCNITMMNLQTFKVQSLGEVVLRQRYNESGATGFGMFWMKTALIDPGSYLITVHHGSQKIQATVAVMP
ncbi:MAG: hypothetical protein DYG96_05765 [Chlorobi bacterium CHB2]|nr:hypothetical protein [Chlorobi bacterium CHB2]